MGDRAAPQLHPQDWPKVHPQSERAPVDLRGQRIYPRRFEAEPQPQSGQGSTSAIELSPVELTEKLAAIVPPFRANQLLYAGVLAGNAAWRKEVVPKVASSTDAEREARASLRVVKRDAKRGRDKLPDDAPLGWAELLKRVFGVDGLECPDCGKRMRLRTVVEGSPAALTITTSLLRSTGPPRPPPGGDGRGVCAPA